MDIATKYYNEGLNIIPENLSWNTERNHWEKRPLIEWKPLKDRRQTQEEFDNLPWGEANAFAVILGQKMKNGMYLAVIDYDVKGRVTEEAKKIGKEILKDFPITQTEQTISNGIHLIYYSRQKPKIDATFHDDAGVELLGEYKLCLMAPSQGYTRLNDNSPTEIENLEESYFQILEKHGFKETEQDKKEQCQDTETIPITKLVDMSKLQQIGSDEYQGKHPIHDSTTDKNFTVNTKYNTWFCFRHNSGGGSLQYFAMQQGIIKCEHAKKGALRGKKFRDTITLAETQGLIKKGTFAIEKEESQADRLVKLCKQESIELFYDQHKTPFIRLTEPLRYCDICDIPTFYNPPLENLTRGITEGGDSQNKIVQTPQIPQYRKRTITVPLRSTYFKDWLSKLMWEQEEKSPGTEAKNSAIGVLAGQCLGSGKQYYLYNRVAPATDGIWLDLSDDLWRAVHITPDGWEIVDNPPILFKRYNSQQAIPTPIMPESGKEIEIASKLLDYVNISKDDEQTKLSYLCTAISYLIPLIPHPMLVVYGPQGSAKSWAFRFIKQLIDPAVPQLLRPPRDDAELIQQLDHHWFAPYDNLTIMKVWMSDIFCTAVTGGGFSKRQLYTDDDDIVYDFKRCVGLNGINPAARRGDLLDRSILIGVTRIPEKQRREEAEIQASFNKEKPAILGAFLNIVSKALKIYPNIKPVGLFRLADFTRYGCAIAEALGKTSADFIKAYESKVESQTEEAINAEPVAVVLFDFLEKYFVKDESTGKPVREKWEGTPAQLYQIITGRAGDLGIKTDSHSPWPRAPNAFTRKLNEIYSSMSAVGYEIDIRPGTPRKIVITIGRQAKLFDAEASKPTDIDVAAPVVAVAVGVPLEKPVVTIDPDKPTFTFRELSSGEPSKKCDCGKLAISKIIKTPDGETLQRCDNCFSGLKRTFGGANWVREPERE